MEGIFADPASSGLSQYLSPVRHSCETAEWGGLLRDRVYFWDFTGVQERIRDAAVGSANVKGENELSSGTVIKFMRHEEAIREVACEVETIYTPPSRHTPPHFFRVRDPPSVFIAWHCGSSTRMSLIRVGEVICRPLCR